MLERERKYYRVTSGICYNAIVAYKEAKNAVHTTCLEYANSKGATGFFPGSSANVGNGRAINALVFENEIPKGWKNSHKNYQAKLLGSKKAVRPDNRTTLGKQFEAEILAIEREPHEDMVCDIIGAPTSIEYERGDCRGTAGLGFWSTCSTAWCDDQLYIVLPDYDVIWQKYEADGYTVATPKWQPPHGMEPILKEEMDLDFAKAKLRRQQDSKSD